jgi:hypothetical protein
MTNLIARKKQRAIAQRGGVASLIESMKEDETLEIFGCEKDGAK